MDQQEIHDKAAEVSRISLDYHFTHAVFACNKLLEDDFKRKRKKETSRLNDDLKKAYRKKEDSRVKLLKKKIASLNLPKYRIFVDYVGFKDPEAARVVRTENQLIISLHKSLCDNTKNADGSYDPSAVQKLRYIMAHELGHIILHTDELLSTEGTQGSKDITGEEEVKERLEQEASCFAEELMRLRLERNEILAKVLVNTDADT